MAITKKNIYVHEMIGLMVEVVRSTSPTYQGIKGKIIDEKKNVFVIETQGGKEKIVPKKANTFRFTIGKEKLRKIDVEGKDICYRPEERLKKLAGRKLKSKKRHW